MGVFIMRDKDVLDRLQVFSFGFLQDAVNLLDLCKRNGIGRGQLVRVVQKKQQDMYHRLEESNRFRKALVDKVEADFPVCPSCELKMRLTSGDEDSSHWVCPKCRFGIYEDEPAHVVLEKRYNGYLNS
jgi:predicted RNA-binding Zn-ribbon protein involved in translation (DUF1610 family)